MNDTEANTLFHTAGDQTPVGPPPGLEELVRQRTRSRRIRMFQVAAVAAVVGPIVWAGAAILPDGQSATGPTDHTGNHLITVPDVIGLPPAMADRVLSQAGLRPEMATCHSAVPGQDAPPCPAPPPGPVRAQEPAALSQATAGATVTLTVDGRADVQQAILGDWNVISSQPVVPDTSTVTFYRNDTDTVTLYDGCQFLGTHYDLDSDGSFHQLGNLDTTDIRCPSIPDSNAAALLAGIEALALNNEAATGYDHDGNVIMTLMRAAANEPTTSTDLNGTWNVRALVGPNGQSVLPDSARDNVRLTFADGEMTGTTGCNDVFGTYEQTGDNDQDLRFPRRQLGSTLVGCTDEPPLVSRLLEVRHVSGSAGVRYLHAVNWMIIAELRR